MNTEERLVQLIVEHFTKQPNKRLTASSLAAQAGISRQHIYQNFDYLIPFIQGKKPAADLIGLDQGSTQAILLLAQNTIKELKDKLENIEEKHKTELINLERSFCTSLMNGDISLHEANEVRITLEKQALQFNHLVSENLRLKSTINELNGKIITNNNKDQVNSKIITIVPDLSKAFKNYIKNEDQDAFEDDKDDAIEKAILKLTHLPGNSLMRIIVYVERYYTNFENFLSDFKKRSNENVILLYLPVHTIAEMKIYINKIKGKGTISLSIPVSDRKAVTTAQRKFHFSEVPTSEFEAADKMIIPTISDGFDEIHIFRVHHGDNYD